MSAVLDALGTPSFLVTRHGAVVHVNPPARALYPEPPRWLREACARPGRHGPSRTSTRCRWRAGDAGVHVAEAEDAVEHLVGRGMPDPDSLPPEVLAQAGVARVGGDGAVVRPPTRGAAGCAPSARPRARSRRPAAPRSRAATQTTTGTSPDSSPAPAHTTMRLSEPITVLGAIACGSVGASTNGPKVASATDRARSPPATGSPCAASVPWRRTRARSSRRARPRGAPSRAPARSRGSAFPQASAAATTANLTAPLPCERKPMPRNTNGAMPSSTSANA